MEIINKYENQVNRPSDINEHLPVLKSYSEKCNHITECGVRAVVSSYAFALGLLGRKNTRLVQIDIKKSPEVEKFGKLVIKNGIDVVFHAESDLTCPIEKTDMLFIDTWHVYGHLKRELSRWNSSVSKWIIMHDTTVDAIEGETIRCGYDAESQSKEHGYPIEEIKKGLWPAIVEFLEDHSEWVIEHRYTNNNGLTILKRV